MAQVIFFELIDINAVVTDLTVLNVVETVDQVCDRCFSGTGTSDKSNLLTRSSKKVYIVQRGS